MINISNALLIVRPVVNMYGDAHGMFASALVTRNVNRILRHGNFLSVIIYHRGGMFN